MKIVSFMFNKGQGSINAEFVSGTKLGISNIKLDYIFLKAARETVIDYDPSAWFKLETMLPSTKRRKNKFVS